MNKMQEIEQLPKNNEEKNKRLRWQNGFQRWRIDKVKTKQRHLASWL